MIEPVVQLPLEMKKWRASYRGTVGFVPTMGALHSGHAELVKRSVSECDFTVVSLFVNPTQFDDKKDLENYPRTFEDDLKMLEELGVNVVFAPDKDSIYPDGYRYLVHESELSNQYCGKHRSGHFDGVLTVVLKLLNIVNPQRAYFGEKDFQQLRLIEGLAEAFFLDCEIVRVPTVREITGLALSSRNQRLRPEQRALAESFAKILKLGKSAQSTKKKLEDLGIDVDYVEDFENRRLAAVRVGEVRLIDNVEI